MLSDASKEVKVGLRRRSNPCSIPHLGRAPEPMKIILCTKKPAFGCSVRIGKLRDDGALKISYYGVTHILLSASYGRNFRVAISPFTSQRLSKSENAIFRVLKQNWASGDNGYQAVKDGELSDELQKNPLSSSGSITGRYGAITRREAVRKADSILDLRGLMSFCGRQDPAALGYEQTCSMTPPIAGDIVQEQNRQLELQARVDLHSRKLAHNFQQGRPKATSQAYGRPQKEWRTWCQKQGFQDGELITEGKMLLFLKLSFTIRSGLAILSSHNMLLRGQDRRGLQFPDLFTIRIEERPTPCWPMIMMKFHGKINQFGRIEYMGVMRHREPLLCTIGQAAFYLFYRWEIMQEPIPQFYQRQQWYDWHFFKGSKVTKPLSYEIQLDWTSRVFKGVGLSINKKSHSGRSGGARLAELSGVDENSIRRASHWNQDSMSNRYLSELPRPFLHRLAGFNPTDQGNYYLPRATVSPPESLVRALWPWVDTWLTWFRIHDSSVQNIDLALELPSPPPLIQEGSQKYDQEDLAAQGFLKLLQQFRTVILQDSAQSASLVQSTEMPSYQLSRTITTVRELWEEWFVGLNGHPSVQSLESEYGTSWRSEPKERVMFGRRKLIIDEILARTKDGTSLSKAVEIEKLMICAVKVTEESSFLIFSIERIEAIRTNVCLSHLLSPSHRIYDKLLRDGSKEFSMNSNSIGIPHRLRDPHILWALNIIHTRFPSRDGNRTFF
ncbi:hypothetical protein TSTA_084150 [Talaromyces stipitatus ATCC 10500]|uniref:Transcription activator GCR1-like domain-containing protein n=1 Tax=Talaromyces stipitatus (strain ATCC 10500 / CBS 375.48 / QM 6759 / NRRL 1006) TaxID=441959 RepID=B8M087_TALSN|nr:uncharacterized protein TSTA_084150 [Talaromyces stipitatus ATCC 10500]EED21184.1 hypothetical protein TSTA_084150 [Talaromyces stipitatus ATCC 10500]